VISVDMDTNIIGRGHTGRKLWILRKGEQVKLKGINRLIADELILAISRNVGPKEWGMGIR